MPLKLPSFYPILDAYVASMHGWALSDLASACFDAGVTLVQVRGKGLTSAELLQTCDDIVQVAEPFGATVVVNDRADIAALSGAGGVHVGQDDLAPGAVRKITGSQILVGLSTHTWAEVAAARAEPIDYLAIGPVFETWTTAPGIPVGLEMVRHAVANAAGRPVVAIGGITLDRARAVLDTGAASLAVIGDLFAGPPIERLRAWLKALA